MSNIKEGNKTTIRNQIYSHFSSELDMFSPKCEHLPLRFTQNTLQLCPHCCKNHCSGEKEGYSSIKRRQEDGLGFLFKWTFNAACSLVAALLSIDEVTLFFFCLCCSCSEDRGHQEEAAAVHRAVQVAPQLAEPLLCVHDSGVSSAREPGQRSHANYGKNKCF